MSKRNLFEYRKIALAPAEHAKVEVTFDGTFNVDDEVAFDIPTTDKLPVLIYAELTTSDDHIVIEPYFNDKALSSFWLATSGDYAWQDMNRGVAYLNDDSYTTGGGNAYSWKPGYKISLKATSAGTGSGKLIIYYAIFA
jgi:hypothetical protein